MGIRMLNHRPTVSRADGGADPAAPPEPVPALAADASTARIPTDLAATLRRAATALRRRLTPREPGPGGTAPWRLWADVARGYLALVLARLPRRPRLARTPRRSSRRGLTVFVVPATPVSDGPDGPPAHRPRRDRQDPRPGHGDPRGPEPDATP
ncbi:hypothetical protein [Streptomyces sp. NPDC086766]|uniref:hypothetical protein n=1 Tax=Streptomyces sp. NPDC086766 TaxID=3365754 RepID=UPI0038161B1E